MAGSYSATEREGATAPSSTSSSAGVVDLPVSVSCEICGVPFGSGRGLSLHQRVNHSEWYHARKGPVFTRPGWSRVGPTNRGEDTRGRLLEMSLGCEYDRKGEGSRGVLPSFPPCNPGRQDENRTDRDGDGTGGGTPERSKTRRKRTERRGAVTGNPAGSAPSKNDVIPVTNIDTVTGNEVISPVRGEIGPTDGEDPVPVFSPPGGSMGYDWASQMETSDMNDASPPPRFRLVIVGGKTAVRPSGTAMQREGTREITEADVRRVRWLATLTGLATVVMFRGRRTPAIPCCRIRQSTQRNRVIGTTTVGVSPFAKSLCSHKVTSSDGTPWSSLTFDPASEHKMQIDTEYRNWIKLELGTAHSRKGPRRRARRREAAGWDEATGPAAHIGKKKRRRADYARVQKFYRANRSECSRKILSGDWVFLWRTK